jgi:hypothetical protein
VVVVESGVGEVVVAAAAGEVVTVGAVEVVVAFGDASSPPPHAAPRRAIARNNVKRVAVRFARTSRFRIEYPLIE